MARKYPEPMFDTLVEPFAGGAGYATWHYKKNVILFEKFDVLVDMWNWLIDASYDDVMRLPVIGEFKHLDELDLSSGAKALIGMNLAVASFCLRKQPSSWSLRENEDRGPLTDVWTKAKRQRVAEQVEHIKHWKCYKIDSPLQIPDYEATWFIDPPYQDAGKHYKHGSDKLNFAGLATWILMRRGQSIVCENDGADWFRFDYNFLHQSAAGSHVKDKPLYRYEVWSHLLNGNFI